MGGLLAGWLASQGGTEAAYVVSGAASIAMTLFAAFRLRDRAVPLLGGRGLPVRAR
jgi:sugar phosphate permease